MEDNDYLSDHFLIAMPGLGDPNFYQSVTYVCRHDEQGALGIVVNRPLGLTLAEVFEQMSLETRDSALGNQIVLSGGPVQPECGFVVHEGNEAFESSLNISESLALTTSRDVLAAMAEGKGPRRALVALGYAGWDAGQLDRELAENAWLSVPCEPDILFATPLEQRWSAAAELIGVDISQLNFPAGHA